MGTPSRMPPIKTIAAEAQESVRVFRRPPDRGIDHGTSWKTARATRWLPNARNRRSGCGSRHVESTWVTHLAAGTYPELVIGLSSVGDLHIHDFPGRRAAPRIRAAREAAGDDR